MRKVRHKEIEFPKFMQLPSGRVGGDTQAVWCESIHVGYNSKFMERGKDIFSRGK